MPADISKSVEVSVRADLKQLLNNLKQIPGMTEKEAKKMVSALNRQLRQTEAASKKAAKASVKSSKQMEQGFNKAAKAAKNTRKQSREIGAALGSLEDVVGGINPELAGMAMEIGIAGQAFRSLSRSLATGNPIILGIIGTLALAAVAYTAFTTEARTAKEIQEGVAQATEEANKKFEKQVGIVRSVTGDFDSANRNLMVLTGQMSQSQADIASAQDKILLKRESELETQEKIIKDQEDLLAIVRKAARDRDKLTEEEEKQLNVAMKINKVKTFGGVLSSNQVEVIGQTNKLEEILLGKLSRENHFRRQIISGRDAELKAVKELIELQEELKEEQAREAKRERAIARARARRAERQQKIQGALNVAKQSQAAIEKSLTAGAMKLADPHEAIRMKFEQQNKELDAQQNKILEQIILAEETAKTEKERAQALRVRREGLDAIEDLEDKKHQNDILKREEIAALNKKLSDQEQKLLDKIEQKQQRISEQRQRQIEAGINATIQGFSSIFQSSTQILQNLGEENKDVINALFRAQQAAALADIAMSTARAVARAPADFGPLAAVAIPTIIASGAVQAGVVLSQPPPLHMGGIVGNISPDERTATLLSGESVLDRRTTRELGSQGVNRLQNGKGMSPEVIVISPFKHLDRYNKSARRLNRSQPRGSGRY